MSNETNHPQWMREHLPQPYQPAHNPSPLVPYNAPPSPNQSVMMVRNQYANGQAVTALILGLCTFVTFGATGIPAIIVGHMALAKVKRNESNAQGMALSGLVLGYLSVAGWVAWWLLLAMGMVMGAGDGAS